MWKTANFSFICPCLTLLFYGVKVGVGDKKWIRVGENGSIDNCWFKYHEFQIWD
jgi:hypothetical protein